MAPPRDSSHIDFALRYCGQEAVHKPGRIQSYGGLIALHNRDRTIDHVSANIAQFLRVGPRRLLGSPLADIFARDTRDRLAKALDWNATDCPRRDIGHFELALHPLFLSAVRSGEHTIIELEPSHAPSRSESAAEEAFEDLIAEIDRSRSRPELCDRAVAGLHDWLGFGRVIVHAFDTSGHGRVVAERASRGHAPFIGLSFPAWDIPPQAMDLIARLPLRLLSDVAADPVPLLSARPDLPVLDQTHALSRATSDVHRAYLGNMETRCSMTLGIRVEGNLWGMIALHDRDPRLPPPVVRRLCVRFAEAFARKLAALTREAAHARLDRLHPSGIEPGHSPADPAATVIAELQAALRADGAAMRRGDHIATSGTVPQVREIEALLAQEELEPVMVATSQACKDLPGLEDVLPQGFAGLLAVNAGAQGRLLFFRRARTRTVLWAGNPEKSIEMDADQPRLRPRASFEPFREVDDGGALPWSSEDLRVADALIDLLHNGVAQDECGECGDAAWYRSLLPALKTALAPRGEGEEGNRTTQPPKAYRSPAGPDTPPPDRTRPAAVSEDASGEATKALPQGWTCLLVDADKVQAADMLRALRGAGCAAARIVQRPSQAFVALDRGLPDVALFAADLGRSPIWAPLVAQLAARGVRVGLMSEHPARDGNRIRPGGFPDLPVIDRTLRRAQLRRRLSALFA